MTSGIVVSGLTSCSTTQTHPLLTSSREAAAVGWPCLPRVGLFKGARFSTALLGLAAGSGVTLLTGGGAAVAQHGQGFYPCSHKATLFLVCVSILTLL